MTKCDVTCDVTKCDPVTPYVTKCDILSHTINRTRNKEIEIEKNIYIDLAIVASQWFKVATYNKLVDIKVISGYSSHLMLVTNHEQRRCQSEGS